MSERRPKLLHDAIGAIEAATQFIGDISLDGYEASLLLRSAVERQLEILGEACTRLSKEEATLISRIPACRLAIGLRNRIIHGYDSVDDETVYRTVKDHLPGLRADLSVYLEQLLKDRP
jgi:uncharacterized protein with HEPN domain